MAEITKTWPRTLRDFFILQVAPLLFGLFFFAFHSFYLAPQQQATQLDQLANILRKQLTLLQPQPLQREKVQQLIESNALYRQIDWCEARDGVNSGDIFRPH